jgi:hypothetical protein
LARDEHGTAIGLKPVKETYQRVSYHLRHLTFETADGTQQTLSTTDEHPFWSVTAEEFIEAGSLIVGHSVTGPNGETQTLVSSAREEFPDGVPVFNFQVTDYHTYFVAASADKPVMLVHNSDCNPTVIAYVDGKTGAHKVVPGMHTTTEAVSAAIAKVDSKIIAVGTMSRSQSEALELAKKMAEDAGISTPTIRLDSVVPPGHLPHFHVKELTQNLHFWF